MALKSPREEQRLNRADLLVPRRTRSVRTRALLKADGANVEATKSDGFTALILSCENGHELCARALLEAGADLEAMLPSGTTALILSCQNGHDQCAHGHCSRLARKSTTPRTTGNTSEYHEIC